MQNLEWLKGFSILVAIVTLLMFLYGLINLEIMNLNSKKNQLEKELLLLVEDKNNLESELEEISNPENLINRAVKELKMKDAEVIFIDAQEEREDNRR